jgi:ATP-binding cassette subfamily F protein 3
VIFPGIDLTVRRGEKIGIIGVNGAGKTTLLRMMAGELEPSGGKITLGYNVKAGYYAQHHADTLHPADTVYDTVAREKPDAGATRVRTVLGAFLFSGDDVEKKVGVLSGGERSRLALAKLLVNPGNLLLMDEPTNHLDLDSSEALAESLTSYDGTLVFVSHNRSFVRRLATRIWNVENGRVETYPGTLDEYMDSCRRRQAAAEAGPAPAAAAKPNKPEKHEREARPEREDDKLRKQREAETRKRQGRAKKLGGEIERLELEIAQLEAAQGERSAALADPEVYADKARSQVLIVQFKAGQQELEQLQSRWERALTELESLKVEADAKA